METQKEYLLLPLAEGAIEAREDQRERLEEFTRRVALGEFHVKTDVKIPVGCIDGRNSADGLAPKPDSAGGTESIFVADDLTTKRLAGRDESTVQGYRNTLAYLQFKGYPVGGHDDDHAPHDNPDSSGCGANDKLPLIYNFIARQGDALRAVAASLGVHTSDESFANIMANAVGRTEFSNGRELLDALNEAGSDHVDPLVGKHNEVVAVINTKEGATLDRVALAEEFGEQYEAFNVDVWSFREAAQITSETEEEVEAKIFAMTMYNLATAHVLCGKNMRVVVL
jgi:hypothetical protein